MITRNNKIDYYFILFENLKKKKNKWKQKFP